MAYGRFGGGGQSNLRSVDAGQAKANKKDADNSRNITIPKVVLPVKKKKKPVTIFGMKIGKPPMSDQEKKMASGQATTIATKAGGKIVTTPTMDNKSLIMNKSTQIATKGSYLSTSRNLANAKSGIGKALDSSRGLNQYKLDRSTKDPVQPKVVQPQTPLFKANKLNVAGAYASGKGMYKGMSGNIGNTVRPKVVKTKLKPITGNKDGTTNINTSIGLVPKISKPTSDFTLLRGLKKLYSSFGGSELTARKILGKAGGIGQSFGGGSNTATTNTLIGGLAKNISNAGSWWKSAGDAQLKKNKQNNARVKAQIGLSAGKSQF